MNSLYYSMFCIFFEYSFCTKPRKAEGVISQIIVIEVFKGASSHDNQT